MSLFEVINYGEYWDVVAVNPNVSTDTVLANRCETQAYAEMLTADLNRFAEIEPMTVPNQHRIEVEITKPRAVRLGGLTI
jgi:hypothetical protein